MSETTDLIFTFGKRRRSGIPLTLSSAADGRKLFSEVVDPFSSDSIDAYMAKLGKEFPGLNGQTALVRDRIVQAAEIKRVNSEDVTCLVLDPSDPRTTAQKFYLRYHSHEDGHTLYSDGSTLFAWDGSRYPETPDAAIRSQMWAYQASAQKIVTRGESEQLEPYKPTSASVSQSLDALHGLAYIGKSAPCWLVDDPSLPDPNQIIPAANGLIHLRPDSTAILLRQPTPLFFSHNALEFAFDPNAPDPLAWLQFLDLLWRDDPASIELLQMWFGYCITSDTRMEKLLMLIGPKRAGKGTIARVLSQLIGIANVCGPTLSGLASHFGLWGLMGKQLAIIDDARLSNRTDQAIITERILTITGGGAIEIHRKNLPPKTERIGARLMMLTNELPRLSDASGALASRFLVLKLTESFYGREDIQLADRLAAELPGILLWAIEGWRKLQSLGKFTIPKTSDEAVNDLNDLASPASAFVRDYCILASSAEIKTSELFDGWRCWCKEQGRDHVGTIQSFGRDLKAAVASIGHETDPRC